MSSQSFLKTLASGVAILAVFLITESPPSPSTRGPASLGTSLKSKASFFTPQKSSRALQHTHKVRGPLKVEITRLSPAPTSSTDLTVRLLAKIYTETNLEDVQYRWILPSGLKVINGQTEGEIRGLSPDVPFEIEVLLEGSAYENFQVHFTARSRIGTSMNFSDTAQYNTLTQELIDESSQALSKNVDAELQKDSHLHKHKTHH